MMLRNVIMKGLHQLRDAAEDPAPNPIRGQVAEEAYHQIEPGATGGHEVHVKPAVSLDPPLDLGMLVGGIVVLDEMERLVLRRLLINQPQERQPFLMAMPGPAGGEDFALGHLERGEARGGPLPVRVMPQRPTAALPERQARLGPVEGLDVTLLIHTQHQRMLRGIEVEPHHICEFLMEARIVAELERADLVRLQPMHVPDAMDS